MRINLGGLFGHSGGSSKEYLNELRNTLGLYDSAFDDAFGPQAFQAGMSRFSEGLDSQLASQAASGTTRLGDAGLRGTPNLGLLRAATLARGGQSIRDDIRRQKMIAILQRLGIVQPLGQATYRQPSGGLLGAVAGMLGQTAGLGSLGGSRQTAGATPPILPNLDEFQNTIPKEPGLSYLLGH